MLPASSFSPSSRSVTGQLDRGLDEEPQRQIVGPEEIGSVKLLRAAAKRFDVETDIAEFELKTQFRCSGSDAYLQWLDKVLGITDSEEAAFDAKMEFKIFSIQMAALSTMFESVSLRCLGRKGTFWRWATDDSGMEQVGTVYTAQGFEFDYVGVIFGPDLIYDANRQEWTSVPERSHDTQVKRNNPSLAQHLKHVYRVLLSRAHRGVYVHFMDKSAENHFRSALLQLQAPTGDSQTDIPIVG